MINLIIKLNYNIYIISLFSVTVTLANIIVILHDRNMAQYLAEL